MEVVTQDLLEEVASMKPVTPPAVAKPSHNGHGEFNLEDWIEKQGIKVRRESEWGRGGYRWVLEECPWNGHTDSAAYIVRFAGGAIAAGCHHNGCQG